MQRAFLLLIAVASLGVLLSGCDDTITTAPSNPPAPTIDVFTAVPNAIQAGDTTELSWSVSGPLTSLLLDDGNGATLDVLEQTKVTAFPIANSTFRLTARNANGSATATATVSVTSAGGDPGSPPAPKSLVASHSGYGFPLYSVELRWQGSSTGVTFLVERRAPGTSFRQVLEVYGPYYGNYAGDGSLAPASTYFYRLRAMSGSGAKSAYSNEAAVTTGGAPITISSIQITPAAAPVLSPGSTFFLRLGADVPGYGLLTFNPTLYTWNSTDPAVATADPFGLVTAGSVGSAQITATLAGVTSNAVTVDVAVARPGGPLARTRRDSVDEYWRKPPNRGR